MRRVSASVFSSALRNANGARYAPTSLAASFAVRHETPFAMRSSLVTGNRPTYRYQSTTPTETEAVGAEDPLASLTSSQIKSELFQEDEPITEVVQAISQVDLSASWHVFARFLTQIHDVHELPWWMIIAGTSVVIKFLTWPLMAKSAGISARLQQEEKATASIRENFLKNNPERSMVKQQEMQKQLKEHYASKGIYPSRMIMSTFLLIPIQIYTFLELRAIIHSGYPGLTSEGLLWFTDLTTPDPLLLLPVAITACSIANSWMTVLATRRYGLEPRTTATLVSKVLTVIFPFVGAYMTTFSSGLQFLIGLNVFTTLLSNLSYRSRLVQRVFNLPRNTGISFSLDHSDPKKVKEAFGNDFQQIIPPPLKKKGASNDSVAKKAFKFVSRKK